MKPTLKLLAIALIGLTATQTISCKKKTEAPAGTTATTVEPAATDSVDTAPIEIASDDQLTRDVRDAIKDFPGVNASVKDGEITLAGEIKRERLTTLMQALHALQPKKINNNLSIK